MQRFSLRLICLIIILTCSTGLVFLRKNKIQPAVSGINITGIPLKIAGWIANEHSVQEETKAILETEAVLIREYKKDGQSIWLSIVYYRDSKVALHLPESCSVGQGSFIVKKQEVKVSDHQRKEFSANKLVLNGNKGNQVIMYYFETNGLKTASYGAMRWTMMMSHIKSKTSSAGLIRVSALVDETEEKTSSILRNFLTDASPIFTKYLF